MHGIRVVNGVANEAIAGSGMTLRRLDVPQLPFRAATVPVIAGSYRSLAVHPRVFTTAGRARSRVTSPDARLGCDVFRLLHWALSLCLFL